MKKMGFLIKIVVLSLILSLWPTTTIAIGSGDPGEGKKLFLTFCSACHGSSGKGDGEATRFLDKKPRDFTDQKYMITKSDQELYDFIKGRGETFHGSKFIPQFKLSIEPQHTWDIIAYIRTLHHQPKGEPIEGRKLYLTYCSTCHGRAGKGDGAAVQFLETKPTDHTDDGYMSTLTDQDLYNAISGGGRAVHKSKFMPTWSMTFKPQHIWDLVSYIRTLHLKPEVKGVADRGKRIYSKYCWVCHGEKGRGEGPISEAFAPRPQDLTDARYMSARTDLDLYYAILGGGRAVGQSEFMPPWGGVLTEQEIWDLILYIRSLKH